MTNWIGVLDNSKPKHNLVCVTGLTPQVVTETVYALGVTAGGGAQGLPAQIHVVTTRKGGERAAQTLLGPDGQLARLCHDYGWDARAIGFSTDHIHVIRDASARELEDIQDEDDNAAAADFIVDFIRRMTRDPAVRLHASLAGGRKTMGFFTGCAMSLYGRPQDRLSHVLVNPPFEFHPDFFYPPPRPRMLKTADGAEVSTADARISLADIPFVRLRHGLNSKLLDGDLTFCAAVEQKQQILDPPELRIDLGYRSVWLQGYPLTLSNTLFLWLAWFADRARRGLQPCAFDEAAATDLLRIVSWLEGAGSSNVRDSAEEAHRALCKYGHKDYYERNMTRLNKSLRQNAGLCAAAAARYEVKSSKAHPARHWLALTPDQIHFEGEP